MSDNQVELYFAELTRNKAHEGYLLIATNLIPNQITHRNYGVSFEALKETVKDLISNYKGNIKLRNGIPNDLYYNFWHLSGRTRKLNRTDLEKLASLLGFSLDGRKRHIK